MPIQFIQLLAENRFSFPLSEIPMEANFFDDRVQTKKKGGNHSEIK